MKLIGGNLTALIQVKDKGTKNSIGETEHIWVDVASTKGFLDLSSGDSKHLPFNAKIQESSHIFLCDFQSFKGLPGGWVWNPFSFVNGVISSATLDENVDVTSENMITIQICFGTSQRLFQVIMLDRKPSGSVR